MYSLCSNLVRSTQKKLRWFIKAKRSKNKTQFFFNWSKLWGKFELEFLRIHCFGTIFPHCVLCTLIFWKVQLINMLKGYVLIRKPFCVCQQPQTVPFRSCTRMGLIWNPLSSGCSAQCKASAAAAATLKLAAAAEKRASACLALLLRTGGAWGAIRLVELLKLPIVLQQLKSCC